MGEDTLFIGTLESGIFRTTDGGNSWVEVNTGLMNTSVSELAVIGKTIYAAIGHRLVYSVDGGQSWQPVKIPSMPIEYRFSALAVSGGKLYIAATRFSPDDRPEAVVGSVFWLDEETNSLVELMTDSELHTVQCMQIVGLTFYVGIEGNGVFRWTQAADSWTYLGLEGHAITGLSVNEKQIHAGTARGEIFRLEKADKPWKLINSDMLGSSISELKWVGSTL